MRVAMFSRLMLIAAGAALIASCHGDGGPKHPKPPKGPTAICSIPQGEKPIDFYLSYAADSNRYLYTISELDSGVANFFTYYKYKANQQTIELDTPNQSLRVQDLVDMYNLLKQNQSLGYNPSYDYAALKMSVGMDGKKVMLIFEPVVLKPTAEDSNLCTITSSCSYFKSQPSASMIVLDSASALELVNSLCSPMSPIYINHPANPEIHTFINSDGPDGDTRSMIMTFQEIFGMYCANVTTPSMADRINFTIAANQMEPQGNFKMHVVVNYKIGQNSPAINTFTGDGADYSTNCPTHCDIINILKDPNSVYENPHHSGR